MVPSGHGAHSLTTSWDLLTPQEGIGQFSEGKARDTWVHWVSECSLHQQQHLISGPAQATELISLGAGAGHSVLTCSQVILILASLRTTALVESTQWDRGKKHSLFHPLDNLRHFSLWFALEFLLPPVFEVQFLGKGGGHLGAGSNFTVDPPDL